MSKTTSTIERLTGAVRGWWPTRRLWLVALFFTLLTLVFLFPLPLHLTDAIIGEPTDGFYFLWLFGWFKEALFELHVSPLFAPQINYPQGWTLTYNEVTPLTVLFGLPFTFIGGPTLGYNVSIIISFILSGVGMYLWVKYITHNHLAAIIAGSIFCFSSYRMVEVIGHPHLAHIEWFPLYFLSLHRLLENKSNAWWKPLILTAVIVLLITLISPYYTYMAMILSAVYIPLYLLLFSQRSQLIPRIRKLSLLAVVTGPLVLLSVAPYLELALGGSLTAKGFNQVNLYSASPILYLVPSKMQVAWNRLLGLFGFAPSMPRNYLFAGAALISLSGIALLKRRQFRDSRSQRFITLLFYSTIAAMVLSLGTNLYWFDQPVTISSLNWPHFSEIDTLIPLPGYFLYKYVPFYDIMRAWFRYGAFFFLFASALSGLGAAYLLERTPGSLRIVLASGLLLLVIVDFYPGFYYLSSTRRPLDEWLSTMPQDGAVIQLPVKGEQTGAPNVYGTLIHGKPYAGDYYASFLTPQFLRYQPSFLLFPYADSIESLRSLGVRYVIVDTLGLDASTLQAIEDRGLQPVRRFDKATIYHFLRPTQRYGEDELTVYILPDETPMIETCGLSPEDSPPSACVEFKDATVDLDGWHPVEVDSTGTSFRWMAARQADLSVQGAFTQSQLLTFRVAYAIAPDVLDSLEVSANGHPLQLSRSDDAQYGWIYSGLIPQDALMQNPDDLDLRFSVDRVATPKSLGINEDNRELGVALDWLRLQSPASVQ